MYDKLKHTNVVTIVKGTSILHCPGCRLCESSQSILPDVSLPLVAFRYVLLEAFSLTLAVDDVKSYDVLVLCL